jgi:hypothetical protein
MKFFSAFVLALFALPYSHRERPAYKRAACLHWRSGGNPRFVEATQDQGILGFCYRFRKQR